VLTAFITLNINPPSPPSSFQVAVTLCDGKRERMTLNQSFTGALSASAPALRVACACLLAQAFISAVKRCI
jgi:hypothetical protein